MADAPPAELWPWLVLHGEHVAWYQGALVRGDFQPGRRPIPNYVVMPDGTLPDPGEALACGTCGDEPLVEDLTPVERATGDRDCLTPFRRGLIPWSKAGHTHASTCYACNDPTEALSQDGYIKLCVRCERHLQGGGR